MMRLKTGVRVTGIKPEIMLALLIAESLWRTRDLELTVTSVLEGRHTRGSEHVAGQAVDVRINDVPRHLRAGLVTEVQRALGEDFDVIWEAQGQPHEHVHVEFDPKAPLETPRA